MSSANCELRIIRKKNGAVYTPSNLASYVAAKTINYFVKDLEKKYAKFRHSKIYNTKCLNTLKIIDPACGHGELLDACWKAVETFLPSRCDPRNVLCGVDIDEKVVNETKQRILDLSFDKSDKNDVNIIKTNALFPFNMNCPTSGWQILKRRFNAENGFDILIANPPWGADVGAYKDKLSNGHFSLRKGQFDTSDLFIELALKIVKDGGYFAFIIPDSLFSLERANLRKLILEHSQVKFIGRFGEKFFENVNRACAVIICKKVNVISKTKIDCLRLTPSSRKAVFDRQITLHEVEKQLAHKVHQLRFKQNRNYQFDIDVQEEEESIVSKIKRFNKTFRDYTYSSRGIELSKSGRICKCLHCALWLPVPNSSKSKCPHCKSNINISTAKVKTIVKTKANKGHKPLIVGENIKRYHVVSRYWIKSNMKGINYKEVSTYSRPKIIVRKTGVGISATIDYTNSLTNQVVYIFKTIKRNIPIETLLAILNSRVIYYFLVKNHGETEWRSHPYLTQSQLLDLPLPDLEHKNSTAICKKIETLLKPYVIHNKPLPNYIDARIENSISRLYGLKKKHYKYVYKTINSSEELLPVKRLKNISISDIFKPTS